MKTFKQFMLESQNLSDELFHMRTRWKEMGVDVYIHARTDELNLSTIKVDKDKRGQGLGTTVMKEILDFAQKHNLRVTLTPSKDLGATSVGRLVKFYRSFGFVPNKGRNKDYRISDTMIWTPKGINN
jgi:predicted GNAT family N-acyltransferase